MFDKDYKLNGNFSNKKERRMTTSISSEAFIKKTTQKIGSLTKLATEKIAFPPKPDTNTDIQTYIQTDGRTDISVYRVASLLKTPKYYLS